MHPNPIFRKKKSDEHIKFARERHFGALIVADGSKPLISHIPFCIKNDGSTIEAHLVRSNPILRLLDQPVEACLAVNGPDAYISPDWYGAEDQVPTWNYVAVHLRGTLTRLPQDALYGILERLSENFEERLLPKKPWTMDKMNEDALAKLMRMIVPIEMTIDDVDGTWKLSQNKPEAMQQGAIEGLATSEVGSEIDMMRELMKNV